MARWGSIVVKLNECQMRLLRGGLVGDARDVGDGVTYGKFPALNQPASSSP